VSWGTPAVTRTARKRHVCNLCEWSILPGDPYLRWCWFSDGFATTVKTHKGCLRLVEEYTNPEPGGSYVIDEEAIPEALSWHEPSKEELIRVAGPVLGRLWSNYLNE